MVDNPSSDLEDEDSYFDRPRERRSDCLARGGRLP
jgi:hypothetical protein